MPETSDKKEISTYTKQEVIKSSLEYFEGDELAADVFVKYSLRDDKLNFLEKNPGDMHKRIAKEFARIERKYSNSLSEEKIFELLDHFRYVIPGGSPMFGIGNFYQKVSLSNCFVLDVVDSYGGICRTDERIVQVSKRRGGCGVDISPLRPKGTPTKNSALTTDGIAVFMERFSRASSEVAQAGRRGALLLSISVHHPEVMTFINIKRDLKKVTGANVSVRVTDEFMEAVKKNTKYEQRWPVDSKEPLIVNKVRAREVWDELIKSVYISAEPGILFWDNIIKNSPADSYAEDGFVTTSTNPCITGETLVYVADGRGNVAIRDLAKEGKDVPVFCYDDKGKITIETMRHPRITGYKQPIYKMTLDDGSVIRATANHKFLTTSWQYKRLDEVQKGTSLKILTRYEAPMPASIKSESGKKLKALYYWLVDCFGQCRAEHRYIAEKLSSSKLGRKDVVHHKDYNGLNNSSNNLVIMSEQEHRKIHIENMVGKNNPMCRAQTEWSEEKWQKYHDVMSKSVSGDKNGRFTGHTNVDLKSHAIALTKQLSRRFSKKDWQKYARKNNLPIEFSTWRKNNVGSVLNLAKWAALECGIEFIDIDPRLVKTLRQMIEQGYNAFVRGNRVFVEKKCEECGATFVKEHLNREVAFCSGKCANFYNNKRGVNDKRIFTINKTCKNKAEKNKCEQLKMFTELKFKLGRKPLCWEWENCCREHNIPFRLKTKYGFKSYKEIKKEAEIFNHRVVSIEFDGYEDVYNGTVDKYHNFFVGGFSGVTKRGGHKFLFLNNANCGELPLAPQDACRLLSLNLSSYVDEPFTDKAKFNEDKFKEHVGYAMRLSDDLVDLELEAIDKIIAKVKSDPEEENIKANEMDLWQGIKKKCKDGRRTGLGITGLADCIAMLNVKYGSNESIKIVDMIYSMLRDEAYKTSIILAKERGPFPVYDHKKEWGNQYLMRLPESIKKEMRQYGRRNIGCLTTPPTGSISIAAQTSWGFEPVFKAEYKRKRKLNSNDKEKADFTDNEGNRWKEYIVEHPGLKKFKVITGKTFKDSPYNGALAEEIDFNARVKMQGVATGYVDHSISSTVNLPSDVPLDTVNDLYLSAWEQGCKGLTVYRAGSRDGVITDVNSTRECADCDEAAKIFSDLIRAGKRPSNIVLVSSPKRPDTLECDIHRSKVGGGDWLFFVGKLNGVPYEVFGGDSEKFTIPLKYKSGWIQKNGKLDGVSQYNIILGSLEDKEEKLEFKGITKHFNNYEYGAFTRAISLSMRHGIPIKYICEQITKTGVEGELYSFQRAMARVLKKYIAEGERSETECPQCHSKEMVYKNGCPECKVCGHSNCA